MVPHTETGLVTKTQGTVPKPQTLPHVMKVTDVEYRGPTWGLALPNIR